MNTTIRINNQITATSLRVIDEAGNNLGVMHRAQAILLAQQAEKDLLEINPTTKPPVCKIMNFGKYLYELRKTTKPKKSPELKEFRFNVNIDSHDLQTKATQIEKLLAKGHPIRVIIIYRGREISHKETGYQLFEDLKSLLPDANFDVIRQEESQLLTMIRP